MFQCFTASSFELEPEHHVAYNARALQRQVGYVWLVLHSSSCSEPSTFHRLRSHQRCSTQIQTSVETLHFPRGKFASTRCATRAGQPSVGRNTEDANSQTASCDFRGNRKTGLVPRLESRTVIDWSQSVPVANIRISCGRSLSTTLRKAARRAFFEKSQSLNCRNVVAPELASHREVPVMTAQILRVWSWPETSLI